MVLIRAGITYNVSSAVSDGSSGTVHGRVAHSYYSNAFSKVKCLAVT